MGACLTAGGGKRGNLKADSHGDDSGAELEAFLAYAYRFGSLDKAFLHAVVFRDIDLVRRLLAAKANAHATSRHQQTALHLASSRQYDSADLIRLLAVDLELGADIHKQDDDGSLPLHEATKVGNLQAVELLIALRADVNAPGKTQYSPLHLASACGSLPCVQALLLARADPWHLDESGKSVLFYAATAPTPHVLDYFLDTNTCDINGAGKHAVDRDGATLVYYAAVSGRPRALQLLLELKCEAEMNNRTFACSDHMNGCRIHCRRLLCEKPTPLFAAAAYRGRSSEALSCVKLLMSARADIMATPSNADGKNLLHMAADWQDHELFSLFRECCGTGGAAAGGLMHMLEERDTLRSMTPLLCAACSFSAECFRALVALGANPAVKTTVGSTYCILPRPVTFTFFFDSSICFPDPECVVVGYTSISSTSGSLSRLFARSMSCSFAVHVHVHVG